MQIALFSAEARSVEKRRENGGKGRENSEIEKNRGRGEDGKRKRRELRLPPSQRSPRALQIPGGKEELD